MATLTIAGHETTASTLSFALYELAKHPEYQERMRQEIRVARAKVMARGGSEFTIEDLDSLTLSVNAIKVCDIVFCLIPSEEEGGRQADPPLVLIRPQLRKRCASTPSPPASRVSR